MFTKLFENHFDLHCFSYEETPGNESVYAIAFSNEEANRSAELAIESTLWAFNPSILAEHTGLDEQFFQSTQTLFQTIYDTGLPEGNLIIQELIKDWKLFVDYCLNSKGYSRGDYLANDNQKEVKFINIKDINLYTQISRHYSQLITDMEQVYLYKID